MSDSSTERLLDWLVVRPARSQPDADGVTAAQWDELLAEAVAHTVAPQLFQRLSLESNVPPQVMQGAFVAMVRQKQHVATFAADLAAALRALHANAIDVILLKGAHLATLIYPEASHRPMADFDLLVRRDDMERAADVLNGIGYVTNQVEPIAEACVESRHIAPFQKSGSFPIELHWALTDTSVPVRIDLDGLWKRSLEVTVFGERARVLSAEDVVLYICVHAGIVHNFGEKGIRPLLDINAILERCALDWDTVVSRAREWRADRSVYLTLELAKRHGGAAIPDEVLAALKPSRVSQSVIEAARHQLFESPGMHLPVHPDPLALVVRKPRAVLDYLKRRGRVKKAVSRYGGFAWSSLFRRNRDMLTVVMRRTARHVLLNSWLTKSSVGDAE